MAAPDDADPPRPAPECAKGDDVDAALGSYLAPLRREWISNVHGHIEARPPEKSLEELRAAPELLVWCCGEQHRALPPLGRLSLCGDERWFPDGCRRVVFEPLWRGKKWCWIDTNVSTQRRVKWITHGHAFDIWNAGLVESARKAADWMLARKLFPELDLGLGNLANGSPKTESTTSVGLCIATKNRLWQLRRALPLNILHCWPHRRWCKIHVVVFGNADGTVDWIWARCRAAIDAGLLKVYTTDELPFWHASIAKNTAHMCAQEDVLVNLDGDNLVGPDFVPIVRRCFEEEGHTAVHFEHGDGTTGRIACRREDFLHLRGYDEDAYPMGAQDIDLVQRLKLLPRASVKKVQHGEAIPNTIEAKVACCSPAFGGLRWGRMDRFNSEIFHWRRDAGQLVRNRAAEYIGVPCWRLSRRPHK